METTQTQTQTQTQTREQARQAMINVMRGDIIKGTKRQWKKADMYSAKFRGFLPENALSAAILTCKFTVQGPQSVGATVSKNWGRWTRTRLATYSHAIPKQALYATQRFGRNWLGFDSEMAVNDILSFAGLSISDVLNHFGNPGIREKYEVSLLEVLDKVKPTATTS